METNMIPNEPQSEALKALNETRQKENDKALVIMASGLGKTFLSAFDALRYTKENHGKILYLSHRLEILRHAKSTFKKVIRNKYSTGYYVGTSRQMDKDIIFGSFQTVYNNLKKFNPNEFSYIIIDESHHIEAPTYKRVFEYFKKGFKLGITATPNRMDKKDIVENFNNNIIYEFPLEKALVQGYLASIDYDIFTDYIRTDLDSYLTSTHNLMEINNNIFLPRSTEEIAEICNKEFEKIEKFKTIIFCPSIAFSEQFASFFEESIVVTSKTSKTERRNGIDGFKNGKYKIILTVDLFNEGIDIPDATSLVFLRSTSSETIFLQQLGRGLRKNNGKEKVNVLDFVAYLERIIYLNDLNKRIKNYEKDMSRVEHFKLGKNIMRFDQQSLDMIKEIERSKLTPYRIELIKKSIDIDTLSKQLGVRPYEILSLLTNKELHPDINIYLYKKYPYPYFKKSRINIIKKILSVNSNFSKLKRENLQKDPLWQILQKPPEINMKTNMAQKADEILYGLE